MKIDILAIAAHPDDVELSCSGTLITQIKKGYKAGILDLTQGELGTRGSSETRKAEAAEAAKIMGLSVRENLGFADGFFEADKEHKLEVIKMIRLYKPTVILANANNDRHPDHGRAAKLVADAAFLSGLSKIETKINGELQEAHRPKVLYHYIQALDIAPDFAIDISAHYETKIAAIMAYKTQFFDPESKEPNTFISSPQFLEFVHARASHYGVPIGVRYAEGFTVQRHIGVKDLMEIY